jgi:PAS domain S-box-containing protein
MNDRLFSLSTPCPDGFTFCREFRARDFRKAPFALYSPTTEAALEFFGPHLPRLAGIILIAGERLSSQEIAPLVLQIVFSPAMLPYLADFAAHQLMQLDRHVSSEDLRSILVLENERLERNSQLASEEFSRYRASLLHEIDERRSTERQLAESEELLRLIMSSTVEAIYGVNTGGVCTFANEACLKMLGYAHIGEVLGRNMHDLIHRRRLDGTPIPVEECRIFQAFRDGCGSTAADEYFWRQDGSCFPVEYSSYPIRKDGTIVGAVVTWHDISERRRAEEAIKESEERFRSIMELSPDIISIIKEDGTLLYNSPAAFMIHGYTQDEMVGLDTLSLIHPDDQHAVAAAFGEVLAHPEKTGNVQYRYRNKDGSYCWMECSARNQLANPHLNGVIAISRNIDDRKKLEDEHLAFERQLLHTQKLESLGVLAGGIAHDFNNILMAIIGNADLALMRINKESPAVDNLHRIEKSAARAADLAKQMLAYSGKGKFMVEHLNMNTLLEDMLHMLEVSISKKAVLRLNLHHSLPSVEADATQMRQIIMNLVINASEAIGEKSGVIAVTTGYMNCDRSYLKNIWLDENLIDGLYVYLEIADSGCGMSKETMARMFDPFFTTKFTGRGLGMAAVLGIVRGHNGAINVYSEEGKGTTFKVLLPATDRPADLFDGDRQRDSWQGSGTVLLVDDEESIRGIGSEMLKELGFTVITANDGREAVELFVATPDIAFVILDLTMPHVDGEQCFRTLRQLKPDVKVIMSSGYSEQEVSQKFSGKGLAGFIQKPYRLSVLREAIQAL